MTTQARKVRGREASWYEHPLEPGEDRPWYEHPFRGRR
jgi:hypothetical protein